MDNETKKILVIMLVAVFGLNFLRMESKKNFENSVLEAIKSNPAGARAALSGRDIPPRPSPNAPAIPPQQAQENPSAEDQFQKQLEDKVTIDLGSTPILGSRNAPIMLVVFSDFQCPFSKRGADTVKALKQKYGEKLMFVHKNLPLPFHPEAKNASKAAPAAVRQGKFYEYHDKLYENQGQLGEETYLKIAKELSLDINRFNTDRNSKEISDQVEADIAQANNLGFNGTPGFALNGVKILGAYPIDHFEKVINALGLG